MSAVCTCRVPELAVTPEGSRYCARCGYWYDPKAGSCKVDPSTTRDLARAMAVHASARRPAPASVGRNDTCPCGSGRKYKKCCLERTSP